VLLCANVCVTFYLKNSRRKSMGSNSRIQGVNQGSYSKGQGTSQGSSNRRKPPEDVAAQQAEKRRSSNTGESKESDAGAHVKNVMMQMAAAAHNVHAATISTPISAAKEAPKEVPGTGANLDLVKNRNSLKDRNSLISERRDNQRRKTIDSSSDNQQPLRDLSALINPSQKSAPRSQPPAEAVKGVEKAAGRQRRKSIAGMPSRERADSGGGDIYANLLALAKDTGEKNDGKKYRNFDKLTKHAGRVFYLVISYLINF
jgi:hypothetical protein